LRPAPGRTSPDISASELKSTWRQASAGLFAGLVVLVILTFRDYGIPSDEQAWDGYGALLLNYYRSGGTDLHATNFWNWHWYGGYFHLINAWVASHVSLPPHEVSHLCVAVTGILGIAGCWWIGNRLGGPRAGFLAALCLTLTPLYYGQMFTNAKDVPFAAAYIWALAAMIDAAWHFPRMSWVRATGIGALMGLAMGIRVGGVILVGYLALAIGANAWFSSRYRVPSFRPDTRALVWRGLLATVVGYLVMLAGWPYALHSPIYGPAHALYEFAHFPQSVEMRFRGAMI